jgi:hypothetical protein
MNTSLKFPLLVLILFLVLVPGYLARLSNNKDTSLILLAGFLFTISMSASAFYMWYFEIFDIFSLLWRSIVGGVLAVSLFFIARYLEQQQRK